MSDVPPQGLLSTYKSLFALDDSLAEIKTRNKLLEYLQNVVAQARKLQPTSSEYFVEQTAEIKLFSGVSICFLEDEEPVSRHGCAEDRP